MVNFTTNIGLQKPLESEFVNINILNENMDKVDQSLGAVNDLPTSATNVAGAISEVYDHLANKPLNQLTLTQGVQVVQGGDVPAILHPTMQGRTLVNLLGRDGNCEDVSKWTSSSSSNPLVLEPVKKRYGLNSIKMTWTNASVPVVTGMRSRDLLPLIDSNGYYILLADLMNGGQYVSAVIETLSDGSKQYHSAPVTDTETFRPAYVKISPAQLVGINQFKVMPVLRATEQNQVGYFDGIRLYKITQTEFEALDTMNADQIAANYPYVDDMKHVNAVYMENKGKNLLPPFSEVVAVSGSVNLVGPYSMKFIATANSQGVYFPVSVVPNTDYSISVDSLTGKYAVFDDAGNVLPGLNYGTIPRTFNTGSLTKIRIFFSNESLGAGTFTFSNPMLNIGSESLPFEPQRRSYLYLPDCNLRSNTDGSVADRLYTDGQGKPRATRRFREMVLDGALAWGFSGDHSGYKRLFLPLTGRVIGSEVFTKFDGKILERSMTNPIPSANGWYSETNYVYISIADTDHGWGENWAGSLLTKATYPGLSRDITGIELIRSFMNGWKWVGTSGSSGNMWVSVVDGGSGTGNADYVLSNHAPNYTPYRLMYQLAQSVDEQVSYEGSLMLHEGDNQVEVGTGIVVREAANQTVLSSGVAYVNVDAAGYTKLSKRLLRFVGIYRDGNLDKIWKYNSKSAGAAYGEYYATLQAINYDPTAAYFVTYLALDTYMLGIAPQTISAEYAPNIRESVDSAVRELVESRTETSVLANTKVQKQQPQWIAPTLLTGISFVSSDDRNGYYKDDSGIVHVNARIDFGTAPADNTMIMILPSGYRPKIRTMISGSTYSNSTDQIAFAGNVDVSGSVRTMLGANKRYAILNFSFRADQ